MRCLALPGRRGTPVFLRGWGRELISPVGAAHASLGAEAVSSFGPKQIRKRAP